MFYKLNIEIAEQISSQMNTDWLQEYKKFYPDTTTTAYWLPIVVEGFAYVLKSEVTEPYFDGFEIVEKIPVIEMKF